jgi:hypothetical protein
MAEILPKTILPELRRQEQLLHNAVVNARSEIAIECATRIQALFLPDRRHHRLLQAKLWAFEACIEGNRLEYAERGLIGIRKLANANTRILLEATALLAICYIRQKLPQKAKPLILEVISNINNIRSDKRRHQFQKRFITRIEEESILSQIIGTVEGPLEAKAIHEKAVQLLQQNNEDEIIVLMGNLVPVPGVILLRDLRGFSILALPVPDRKLLPEPQVAERPRSIGIRVKTVLQRIAWRTICDPESTIYKAWSQKIPKVYSDAYFAASLTAAFTSWRIGIPLLVSGVVAIVMKYSANEFCDWAKPKGVMIEITDKELQDD